MGLRSLCRCPARGFIAAAGTHGCHVGTGSSLVGTSGEMSKARISCLGVMVVDALSRPLKSYPIPGKRPQVVTQSICFQPGGGCANTSLAFAQMGIPVRVFSKIGTDPNGQFLLNELERHNVETCRICRSPNETTPFTYVSIHPNGERTFIHTPGTNRTFTLSDIDCEALLETDFLFYQDLWVLPGIDGPPGAELLAKARERGLVTFLDECWGLGPDRKTWEMMLPHADYVLPSLDDMKAIYAESAPERILQLLHERGARNIVLKMGKDGAVLSSDGRTSRIPTYATGIMDTTGAGDCFDAGFIAGLAHDLSAVDAAHIGSLAAAACVRQVGGAVGIPSFASLWEELKRRKLVR